MRILVTGGAGFIGSDFARTALYRWPDSTVVVLDALSYAGNLERLADVRHNSRFSFIHGDISDPSAVLAAMSGCDWVVNFAAETHVDRSIADAAPFIKTNVEGTRVLLEGAREHGVSRYVQVSTDEVYGEIEAPLRAREDSRLRPRSPYAASKASGDLLVGAYHATCGLPTLITRGANTYGPFQYPEKLVPLFVTNALDGLPLPVYGDGRQVREWLHVTDHCEAIALILERGAPGETYNIGAENELPNRDVVERILRLAGASQTLRRHVSDRPGHDRRYALDTKKLRMLGWQLDVDIDEGLASTVRWYAEHREWWEPIKSGAFLEYYERQYAARLRAAPE